MFGLKAINYFIERSMDFIFISDKNLQINQFVTYAGEERGVELVLK